jgi:O-antigen/teichoic acid export membrane protein
MSLKSRLFSHTGYQSIADSFMILFGVISSVVYARILGPVEYGRLSFLLWLLTVFGLIIGMGFNGTLSRYVSLYHAKEDKEQSGRIVSTVLSWELAISLSFVIVLLVLRTKIASYFNEPSLSSIFFVIVLTIIPSALVDVLRFSLTGLQKIRELSIVSIVFQALSLVCNCLAVWLGYGVQGVIVVSLILLFPRLFVLYIVVRRSLDITFFKFTEGSLSREIFKYNLSIWVIVITDQIIWQRSEIFFLQRFCSPDQIAYYSLAFGWAMRFVGFIPGILGGFLIPVMSELYGRDNQAQMNEVFLSLAKYTSFVIIPLTLGAIAVSKNLVYVLYGEKYLSVPALLIPVFLAKGFISLYVGASAMIFASGRQKFIVKWGLILALLNLILDYFLIKAYAALGAVWATSIVHVFAAVITLVYLKKTFGVQIPFNFQFKVLVASLPMFFLAHLISINTYNVGGLCLAVLVGIASYLFAAKLAGVFSGEDTEVLLFLKERVPVVLKSAFERYFNV